jgi:hypothetical protein
MGYATSFFGSKIQSLLEKILHETANIGSIGIMPSPFIVGYRVRF